MSEVIHMFSSDSRPTYTQDVLNVVAAPEGTLYKWRYKKQWFNPSDPTTLQGRSALLWYVHMEQGIPNGYVPLRKARITVVEPSVDRGYYIVKFVLGPIVAPTGTYSAVNTELQSESSLPDKGIYVTEGRNIQGLHSNDSAWNTLIQELAGYQPFATVTFYKFHPVVRSGSTEKAKYDATGETLLLREEEWYELRYQFRQVNEAAVDGVHTTLTTHVSEGLYTTARQSHDMGSPYDSDRIRFRGKATYTQNYGNIRLSTKPPAAGFELALDVMVYPHNLRRGLTTFLFGTGAIVLGSNAVLPVSTPLSLRLFLLMLGTVLVVVTKNYGPGERLFK